MIYTQLKIKVAYREKLAKLAAEQNRSMANMVEVLIDQAVGLQIISESRANVELFSELARDTNKI